MQQPASFDPEDFAEIMSVATAGQTQIISRRASDVEAPARRSER
jgi:hypothetical protein